MAMDRETLDRILAEHEAWSEGNGGKQADLRGADLAGMDLQRVWLVEAEMQGAKLGGANLTGAWLEGANLSESDLQDANLTRATLTEAILQEASMMRANCTRADFRAADLRWVNFHDAQFPETDLRKAELEGAGLQGADLTTAYLRGAKLDGALLEGATYTPSLDQPALEKVLRDHELWLGGEEGGQRAELDRTDLSGMDLTGADLARASLVGATLDRATLHGANLAGADLTGASLQDAQLQEATLTRAGLREADLTAADLREARLDGADLQVANLERATLVAANLCEAHLPGARLTEANMQSADLEGAYAVVADFQRATLENASLRHATLEIADLEGASLRGAQLQEANLARAFLREADLTAADLTAADFHQATVVGATLDTQVHQILTHHQEWVDGKGGRPATYQEAELVGRYQRANGVAEHSGLAHELYERVQRAEAEAAKEDFPASAHYDGQLAADFRPAPSRWETIKQRVGAIFSRGETPAPEQEPATPSARDERVGKQVLLFPTKTMAEDAASVLPQSYEYEVQPTRMGNQELYAGLISPRTPASERRAGAEQPERLVEVSVFGSKDQAESHGRALASSHEYEVQRTMMGKQELYAVLTSPRARGASQEPEPATPSAPSPAPQAGRDPAVGQQLGPATRPLTYEEGRAAYHEVLERQDEIKATIAGMAAPAEREKAERLLATVQQDAAARQRSPDRGTSAELDR